VQTSGEVYECGDSSIDSTRLDDPRGTFSADVNRGKYTIM
jgi:hypothetical protein